MCCECVNFKPKNTHENLRVEPNIFYMDVRKNKRISTKIMLSNNPLQYFWDSNPRLEVLNFFLHNTLLPIVNTNPLLLFNVKLTLARWGPGNHFNGLIIGWPSGIVVYMSKYPTGYVLPKGCCTVSPQLSGWLGPEKHPDDWNPGNRIYL